VDVFLRELASFVAGGVGGAVVVIVALRTRLALMDVRSNRHDEQIEALEVNVERRFGLLEKRGMLQLQLIAGIARKVGVDARFDDLVVRLLAGEDNGEGGRS
jgi:hypothetical protein